MKAFIHIYEQDGGIIPKQEKTEEAPPPPPTEPASSAEKAAARVNPPKRIGGPQHRIRMYVFGVIIAVLQPIFFFAWMGNKWKQAQQAFVLFPTLKAATLWELTATTALVLYGMSVGCAIWSAVYYGNPNDRRIARKYLRIQLLGPIGISLIAVVIAPDMRLEITTAVRVVANQAGLVELGFFLFWSFVLDLPLVAEYRLRQPAPRLLPHQRPPIPRPIRHHAPPPTSSEIEGGESKM